MIRQATVGDAAMLATLGRNTFAEAFAHYNSPSDMVAFLDSHFGLEHQTRELSNPNRLVWLAMKGEDAIGFVELDLSSTHESVTIPRALRLQRLYILQPFYGQGIAARLMTTALQEARQRGFQGIWLGVWEKNERALAFYQKWGFERVGQMTFWVGNDPQTDFVMQRQL